jgi:multiple antibiotic resistance protein
MLERIFQLIILFLVIFDPLASISVFIVATKEMANKERLNTALLSVLVAAIISFSFLIFGQNILLLFDTTINDFKAAAGIILGILGIKMVLGESITNIDAAKNNSGRAIAAIIGTPLLTGPAAITTIIVSVHDYGMLVTGIAVTIVLVFTAMLFLFSGKIYKIFGVTTIQVITTILGLITISWGVKFVKAGFGL